MTSCSTPSQTSKEVTTIIDFGVDGAVWIREEGIYFGDATVFDQITDRLSQLGYTVTDTRERMRGLEHSIEQDEFLLWGVASPKHYPWMMPDVPYGFPESAWLLTKLAI